MPPPRLVARSLTVREQGNTVAFEIPGVPSHDGGVERPGDAGDDGVREVASAGAPTRPTHTRGISGGFRRRGDVLERADDPFDEITLLHRARREGLDGNGVARVEITRLAEEALDELARAELAHRVVAENGRLVGIAGDPCQSSHNTL